MQHDPVLRKPSGTIQLTNPFTHLERKFLNILLFYSQKDEQVTAEAHDISLEDIFDSLGWTSKNNVEELKVCARTLLSRIVEWNSFNVDRRHTWVACQFLTSFEIKDQRLRYRINPEIVAQCRRPELYGQIRLLVQTQLKSKHTQVLYEYFQDELGRHRGQILTIKNVPLANIRSLLGLEESDYYTQYKFLNGDILKPSLREINKHSDVSAHHAAVRRGRTTVGVDFTLERSKTYQLALDLKNGNKTTITANEKLRNLLKEHGVNAKTATKLIKEYSVTRIENNVKHLQDEIARGVQIANRGGWLRNAIEEDWHPKMSPAEIAEKEREEAAGAERIRARIAKEREEERRKEFAEFRSKQVRKRFANMPDEFQEQKRRDFVANIETSGDENARKFFREKGWENGMIDALFFAPLHDELLTEPNETSFEAYCTWQYGDDTETSNVRDFANLPELA